MDKQELNRHLEEVKNNLTTPAPYVHIELSPDTLRERAKKHHEMSQLEREARMLDAYFVKKGDKLCLQ